MRYLPQTQKSREEMLEAVGVSNVDELYKDVPASAFIDGLADVPNHMGELEVERLLGSYANENIAASNAPFSSGQGLTTTTFRPVSTTSSSARNT